MNEPERPDVTRLRRQLTWLIAVLVVLVASLLWFVFHFYARWTEGIRVTP